MLGLLGSETLNIQMYKPQHTFKNIRLKKEGK